MSAPAQPGAGEARAAPDAARRPLPARSRLAQAFSLRRNLRALFTPADSNLRAIDGLRALSILWMIAFHTLFYLGYVSQPAHFAHLASRPILRPFAHGQAGVDVFFVISGFLIARLLLAEQARLGTIRVRRFYWRRALRLLPAYYVALAIYCLLIPVNRDTFWANLLYVNNFLPVARQCMAWAWSLAIEEQFYIVFPGFLLLLGRFGRTRLPLLLGLLAAGFALRALLIARAGLSLPIPFHAALDAAGAGAELNRYFDLLYDKPWTRYGGLLAGVIVAWLERHTRVIARLGDGRLAPIVVALAVAGSFAALLLPDPYLGRWSAGASFAYLTAGRYVFALGVAALIALSLGPSLPGRAISRFLSARLWHPVAQLSYSAYLLHPVVIIALYFAAFRPRTPTLIAVFVYYALATGLTHLAALALYLGIERPCMNLRRA